MTIEDSDVCKCHWTLLNRFRAHEPTPLIRLRHPDTGKHRESYSFVSCTRSNLRIYNDVSRKVFVHRVEKAPWCPYLSAKIHSCLGRERCLASCRTKASKPVLEGEWGRLALHFVKRVEDFESFLQAIVAALVVVRGLSRIFVGIEGPSGLVPRYDEKAAEYCQVFHPRNLSSKLSTEEAWESSR